MTTKETAEEDEIFIGSGVIMSVIPKRARNGNAYQRVEFEQSYVNSWMYRFERMLGARVTFTATMECDLYPTLQEIVSLEVEGQVLMPGPEGDWSRAVPA